ncbi:MAG TPA: hypothetical protein EYP56_20460, partial [Planctomycetaceae bacterium]|nr:hypothetical protein [Planctomycetaceae bacterium]
RNGEWRMANGEWRVASGEWRMANGEWRMSKRFPHRSPRAILSCPLPPVADPERELSARISSAQWFLRSTPNHDAFVLRPSAFLRHCLFSHSTCSLAA